MGLEGDGCLKGVTIFVIKTSLARSEDNGSNQCRETTRHMDDTGSRKVDASHVTKVAVIIESGKETVGAPHRVRYYWVHKTRQEDRVAEIGRHLASFGDSTSNDSSGSRGESELKEEINPCIKISESKVTVTNKGRANLVGSAVRKTVTDGVESDRSSANI